MNRTQQGNYVVVSTYGESVQAFVPPPLPPEPPIEWTDALRDKFEKASFSIGQLSGFSCLPQDTQETLSYLYARKEAVFSSMIEGTQSSLSDIFLYELEQAPRAPIHDVEEVHNYVAALDHGLKLLDDGDLPLSLRLFKEMHRILLSDGRSANKMPGEFRSSQNWIGGTRPGTATFVPPPANEVMNCMGQLELFLHDESIPMSALAKAALAHVQLETIHPFLDGNGRIGRMLITLLLRESGLLKTQVLYISLYFFTYRERYYELLNNVRVNGDWEAWLDFFANAVIETVRHEMETTQQLLELAKNDLEKSMCGRRDKYAASIHLAMMQHPIASSDLLVKRTGIHLSIVNRILYFLEKAGVIRELTGRKTNKLYAYDSCLGILLRGMRKAGEEDPAIPSGE